MNWCSWISCPVARRAQLVISCPCVSKRMYVALCVNTLPPGRCQLFPNNLQNVEVSLSAWNESAPDVLHEWLFPLFASCLRVAFFVAQHWIANNLFGLAFALNGVELLQVNQVSTGCILLAGLFVYDIFWVRVLNLGTTLPMLEKFVTRQQTAGLSVCVGILSPVQFCLSKRGVHPSCCKHDLKLEFTGWEFLVDGSRFVFCSGVRYQCHGDCGQDFWGTNQTWVTLLRNSLASFDMCDGVFCQLHFHFVSSPQIRFLSVVFPQDLLEKGLAADNFAMLGLGDIVIPGIFIALLLRFDIRSVRWRILQLSWNQERKNSESTTLMTLSRLHDCRHARSSNQLQELSDFVDVLMSLLQCPQKQADVLLLEFHCLHTGACGNDICDARLQACPGICCGGQDVSYPVLCAWGILRNFTDFCTRTVKGRSVCLLHKSIWSWIVVASSAVSGTSVHRSSDLRCVCEGRTQPTLQVRSHTVPVVFPPWFITPRSNPLSQAGLGTALPLRAQRICLGFLLCLEYCSLFNAFLASLEIARRFRQQLRRNRFQLRRQPGAGRERLQESDQNCQQERQMMSQCER